MNAPFLGGFLCGVLFELAVTGVTILVLNCIESRKAKKLEKKLLKQMRKGLRGRK